jgi:hypothetical protein
LLLRGGLLLPGTLESDAGAGESQVIIRDFPLFDTEVLYKNIAKRGAPLYFFQRPMGQRFEGAPLVKQDHDTNLTMAGCIDHHVEFRARGFFVSFDAAPNPTGICDLDRLLGVLLGARVSSYTGWLGKQGGVLLRDVPVHPMSILQPCPDKHFQLWRLADPNIRLCSFARTLKNAAVITSELSWDPEVPDPGLESPVRLRLVVVGDLEAPDGYWETT